MKVVVQRNRDWDTSDPRSVLARFCEDFVEKVAAAPELKLPLFYPEVHVVLGGEDEADHWGADGDALGFFAVTTPKRIDDNGEYIDVNERLEVHLNLDHAMDLFANAPKDELHIELESWLVTLPHELLHVADWMKATEGKTPLQLYDDEKGEIDVARILNSINRSYEDAGLDAEDEIDEIAMRIMRKASNYGEAIHPYVEELAALSKPRERRVLH